MFFVFFPSHSRISCSLLVVLCSLSLRSRRFQLLDFFHIEVIHKRKIAVTFSSWSLGVPAKFSRLSVSLHAGWSWLFCPRWAENFLQILKPSCWHPRLQDPCTAVLMATESLLCFRWADLKLHGKVERESRRRRNLWSIQANINYFSGLLKLIRIQELSATAV